MTGPIFARELLTTPRRPSHFALRAAYVTLFLVLVWTAWQSIIGFGDISRAGDVPAFHQRFFPIVAYLQLVLTLFVAALYGTSALSHEKDRRTLLLLIMTRLPDREILVDKFLTGVLQVATMLLAALPVFVLLLLFGGVGPAQVGQAYAATVGSALAANGLGVLVAAWREKTFQSVALTILGVVLALAGVEAAVAVLGADRIVGPATVGYWAACVSPLRAMASVIDPTFVDAAGAGLPPPALVMFGAAALATTLLLTTATLNLRRWYPAGEPVMAREPNEIEETAANTAAKAAEARAAGVDVHADPELRRVRPDRHRKPWTNPVLWRETRTRAYGTRPFLVKLGYLAAFGILALALARLHVEEQNRRVILTPAPAVDLEEDGEDNPVAAPAARSARNDLTVGLLVSLVMVLSLLLVNTQSVTSVTSERDIKALDLLLVTRLEPPEFIFGKLLGVLYNAREMVLAPLLMVAVAALFGAMTPTGAVYSALVFAVFAAFAVLLGIHAALRYDSSRVAIGHSLGTMFLLSVGIGVCLELILVSGKDRFAAQWLSFLLFIVLGSIALWVSLSANAPSNALALTAAVLPFATFYCVIAFVVGDRTGPFLVALAAYGFGVAALLIPLLAEFDVATGRTTAAEG